MRQPALPVHNKAMSFRRVLGAGLAALIFVTLLTSALSIVALRRSSAMHEEVTLNFERDVLAIEAMRHMTDGILKTYPPTQLPAGDIVQFNHRLTEMKRRATPSVATKLERSGRHYITVASKFPPAANELLAAYEEFEEDMHEFLQTEEDNFQSDLTHARAVSGQQQLIVVFATVLGITLGIVLAFLVMRRLTTQYQRERTATAVARRESAARQEVLAVVSHDLRNPLGAIALGASLLAETMPDAPERTRRTVNSISNAANRMTSMIEEILDDARIDAGTIKLAREPFRIATLIDSTVELFADRAAAQKITLRREGEDALVNADQQRVHQVLSNLMGNAFRYTPDGGEIVVGTTLDPDHVTVQVRDTGPGIPADHLPRLFERYWQRERGASGGLGLGLYICKNLVEAHGGRIWAESTVGSGTQFYFTLPRAG